MSGSQLLLLGGVPAAATPVDPYFYSVTSLLHGDGTNGGQNNTFLDSSSNNFTITRNGNTTQGSFSPFSQTGWGNYFDGTGDYLTVADNAALELGSGDWTLECWYYQTVTQTYSALIGKSGTSAQYASYLLQINSLTPTFYLSTSGSSYAVTITSSVAITNNAWYHLSVVRSGNTITLYVNGTSGGSAAYSSTPYDGSYSFAVGAYGDGSYPINGYVSNARLVKGTAVYTANFTPPTTPLTAISGTSLLTCQSNRFIDNSTNAFAITRNGDVSVQPFSPFNPTTAYSASSIGGSGYFDGSGDYLNGPSTGQFAPTGNFTISMWIYPTSFAAAYYVLAGSWNTGTSDEWLIQYDNTGAIRFLTTTDSTFSAAGVIKLNQWQFISISRSGSTLTGYVNGTSFRSYTLSGTVGSATKVVYIGAQQGTTWPYAGYMADFRLVAGSAESATPPTAPATAISGTNMLLNFTNGAIFDNAAVADYETVGNAQISTSVKKYGTGSMAFDGNGDVLSAPDNEMFRLSSGDFTIECWVYPTANGALYDSGFASYGAPSTLAGWFFGMTGTNTGGTLNRLMWSVNYAASGGAPVYGNTGLPLNTWSYVAVTKIGTTVNLFINGNLDKTATVTATPTGSSTYKLYVGAASYDPTGTQRSLTGYIDDLRITKGIARYPYSFTPPTAAFPDIGGTVTLTADPYYEYTTLLLPGNGTNGAQNNTFLDSSTNAFTITRNGNTTQGTFSPFSQTGWSNNFDGSGDYLTFTGSSALTATGDFTFECWIYVRTIAQTGASNPRILTSPNGLTLVLVASTNNLRVDNDGTGTSPISTANNSIIFNQWMHVAVVRSGSTLTAYLNGTAAGSATHTSTFTGTGSIGIGYTSAGPGGYFDGYISNMRMVVGTAVYTANFTPPTAALTAITNTQLLTCQSNRFIDNSSNAFAITRNGDASVQAFSPFNPTASWSAATYGGSGYFDGSGDYLTTASSANLAIGTSDFCIEYWVYSLNTNEITPFGQWATGNADWILQYRTGPNQFRFYYNSSNELSGNYTMVPNQWTHVAVCRSGTTMSLYVNGTRLATKTDSTSINNGRGLTIGVNPDGPIQQTTGYITDARLVVGSSVYTPSSSTLTVPTAPLTAITNTKFLTNFTNAGIYDATSKNDLETVGNAQISTTQSKFGGSSMYFDGAGDYLVGPWNSLTDLGAGDFTIEFWMYPTAVGQSSVTYLFYIGTSGNYAPILIGQAASGYGIVLYSSSTGSSWNLASGSSFGTATANAWNHVALTRYGADVRLFLNGAVGTTLNWGTTALLTGSSHKPNIGSATGVANTYYTGYMQDLRVTKGIARYTSNFTPPTTAFLTL